MTCLTLFAGTGGADLGLQRAGFTHLACVEGDATACRTLAAAGFPAVHAWIGGGGPDGQPAFVPPATPVDLLWASPPCQPYSRAGKRLGAADERDGWPATLQVIEQVRPRWVIVENVVGAPVASWAEALAALGYVVSHAMLDAADWGLPSHRRRLFVVAGPVGYRWPDPTHYGPDVPWLVRGERLPWVGFGEALGLVGAVRATRESEAHKPVKEREEQLIVGPCQCIGASYTGILAGQPYVLEWGEYAGKGRGASSPHLLNQPAAAVCTTEVKGTRASAASNFDFHGGPDRASDSAFLATGRRRLTWQECATLVGFPASHPFQGTTEARYRQVGNAVAPVMAQALAQEIRECPPIAPQTP